VGLTQALAYRTGAIIWQAGLALLFFNIAFLAVGPTKSVNIAHMQAVLFAGHDYMAA